MCCTASFLVGAKLFLSNINSAVFLCQPCPSYPSSFRESIVFSRDSASLRLLYINLYSPKNTSVTNRQRQKGRRTDKMRKRNLWAYVGRQSQ